MNIHDCILIASMAIIVLLFSNYFANKITQFYKLINFNSFDVKTIKFLLRLFAVMHVLFIIYVIFKLGLK